MKRVPKNRPVFTGRPLAMALTSALLLAPAATCAEPMFMIPLINNPDMSRYDTNYIELGGLYNDNDGGGFGQWNGIRDENFYFLGNLNLMNRDDKTATYYNLTGRNLGLDSRRIGGNFGHQGKYGLFAEFSQFNHLTSDSTQFIFNGLGGSILTLPGTFTPKALPNASIPGALRSYDIEQKRNVYKFGGNVFFSEQADGLISFRIDDRRGDVLTGARIGGMNPAVQIPRPVDDSTQQMEAKLRWHTEKAQLEGVYYFSKYSNSNESLTWQNPFNTATTIPWGRMSLDPDNYFHQVQLSGGYNFTPTTRLTGVASYGMMRQDATYQPYSVTSTLALPRSSLDAAIDNLLLDLKLTTRLFDKLNIKAAYNYNDYNNRTPVDQYFRHTNDGNQPNLLTGGTYNNPYSWTQNKFVLDASYPLGAGYSLRGYYNYKRVDYDYPNEVNNTAPQLRRSYLDDNILGIEALKRASAWVTGSLKYEYQQRRGDDFRPYRNDTGNVLREYYIADYDQNKLQGKISLTPADALSFSLTGDWYQREYQGPSAYGDNGWQGRHRGVGQSYTIDGQWTPINGLSAYAFCTWSQLKMKQDGTDRPANNPTDWGLAPNNRSTTIGVGLRYMPESRKYDVGLQYVWDDSTSPIDGIWSTSTTQPAALPDAKYRMDYVEAYGSYMVDKNIKLRLNCAYAHLNGDDWMYDVATPTNNAYIYAGQGTANHNNFLVAFTVAYLWE